MKTIEINYSSGIVLQIDDNNKIEIKYKHVDIIKNKIPKNGKACYAINIDGKKHYISIDYNRIIKSCGVSIYHKNLLTFTNRFKEEKTWDEKRLKILNRKANDKINFGVIVFDNLISNLISRLF